MTITIPTSDVSDNRYDCKLGATGYGHPETSSSSARRLSNGHVSPESTGPKMRCEKTASYPRKPSTATRAHNPFTTDMR